MLCIAREITILLNSLAVRFEQMLVGQLVAKYFT